MAMMQIHPFADVHELPIIGRESNRHREPLREC